MRNVKRLLPFAASLLMILMVTALLWRLKIAFSPRHLVFYYLLPTAFVAVFFGSVPAVLSSTAAALCAAYFLYDPTFSFYISDRLEIGEMVCFAVLALLGSKCASDAVRPPLNIDEARAP
jgi:K+-sensing histidine kinase KdpD